MLENQQSLFSIDQTVTYLNAAYMSPQLKELTQIGIDQMKRKNSPDNFVVDDFFEPRSKLKKCFAELIGAEDHRSIAIVPSVSYGIASVANNISIGPGEEILLCDSQFPSNYYSWKNLADKNDGTLIMVDEPPLQEGRAKNWNERILNAINIKTKVVSLPQVHWADGTLFDLVAIREKTSSVGAKLIIDGTQSIGAFPFSIEEVRPDALICAGYKWLLGPYGMGVAYYAESFWEGEPIEHSWMNRYKSDDFANLTKYQNDYQPGAERYSVGESSNFILLPMLSKSIEQVNEWGSNNIQIYCGSLIHDGVDKLRSKGCFIEDESGRGNHLFGVYIPKSLDKKAIEARLKSERIFVSNRGDAIRVSPHVYNTKSDFEKFVNCIY